MTKAILLNDTSVNNHHGCTKVISNFEKFFSGIDVEIIYQHPVGIDWENDAAFLSNLDKSQVLIINGEGTIHHGSTRGTHLLESIPFAKQKGKKVLLLNMTYQSNPIDFAKYLRQVDFISVRESFSEKELLTIGVESLRVPDFTYFLSTIDLQNQIQSRKKVIVTDSVYENLSSILFKYTQVHNGMSFMPILSKNPNLLLWSRFSLGKLNLPSKLTIKRLFTKPADLWKSYFFNKRLYKKTTKEPLNYINAIAISEGILTARFHALCFAIQQKKKFLTIRSNSFKIEAMLTDIGIDKARIIDEEEINTNLIIPDFTSDELKNIEGYLQKSTELFKLLKNSILNVLNSN